MDSLCKQGSLENPHLKDFYYYPFYCFHFCYLGFDEDALPMGGYAESAIPDGCPGDQRVAYSSTCLRNHAQKKKR